MALTVVCDPPTTLEETLETNQPRDTSRLNQSSLRQLIRNTERESVRVGHSQRVNSLRPSNRLPGDHSVVEPPDPIPNSEVKRNRADGSVAQAMQE